MYTHFALALDCLLSIALFTTMIFLSRTRKDLEKIRSCQKGLDHFSEDFSKAVQRSEYALKRLQEQKEALSQKIHAHSQHVETLLEDLKYATERADRSFRRLSPMAPHSASQGTAQEMTPLMVTDSCPSQPLVFSQRQPHAFEEEPLHLEEATIQEPISLAPHVVERTQHASSQRLHARPLDTQNVARMKRKEALIKVLSKLR